MSMTALTWPRLHGTLLAGGIVGVIGAGGAAVLMQLPLVWLALVTVGALVVCGSLVATNAKLYWLSIFLLAVPLNVTKLFFWSPEDVSLLKRQFHIYVNENMVPQLYLADLPLAMLLVLWASDVVVRRRRIVVPRMWLVMGAFLVWTALTVVTSRAPVLGLTWLVYETKLALLFLWFANAGLGREEVRKVCAVMLCSVALQSGVVFYSYAAQTGENIFGSLFGVEQTTQEQRVGPARGSGASYVFEQGSLRRGTGTIGTANLEAKYFAMLLPLGLVATVCARRPAMRLLAGAVTTAGVGALCLTFSRGGLLTGLFALALVPILLARAGLWRRKTVVTAFAAGATALAVAAPFLLSYINSRPGFTRSRLDHTLYGLQVWWEHPLAGVGMNNFNLAVPPQAFEGVFTGTPIHNHYLRIAIETGLFGFVLYFAFFAWALWLAFRLSAARDPLVAAVSAGVCAGLAGLAVYFSQDLFYDPIIRTQLWILIGLCAVLAQIASGDPRVPRLVAAQRRSLATEPA